MAQLIRGRWRAQCVHPLTGRRTSAWFLTREEAHEHEARIATLRRHAKQGTKSRTEVARAVTRGGPPVSVAALLDAYGDGLSPSTKRRAFFPARARLAAAGILDEPPEALTTARIQRLVTELAAQRYAPATIRSTVAFLQTAVRLAVPDFLDAIPWGRVRLPSVGDSPREACRSMPEFESLCEIAHGADERSLCGDFPRFSDAFVRIVVLGLTGLRSGEACALSWKDVSLEFPARITVHRQVLQGAAVDGKPTFGEPKNRKTRVLALHPAAVAALRDQRALLRLFELPAGDDDPVFPARGGGFRSDAIIMRPRTLRKLVKEAGFANPARWTVHSLRHTFVTLETAGAGGDLRAVQARSGHSSMAALSGYVHGLRELSPALAPYSARLLALAGDHATSIDAAGLNAELAAAHEPRRRPSTAVDVEARRAADRARKAAARAGASPVDVRAAGSRARLRAYRGALVALLDGLDGPGAAPEAPEAAPELREP